MKKLITILLFFIGLHTFAQDSTTIIIRGRFVIQTHGDTLPTPPVDTTGEPTENVAGNYDYTLPEDSWTSAGVYDSASGALIRTLFSGKRKTAGQHTGHWDGLDDNGNTTEGSYEIRVVSNNIQSEWLGVLGNTLSDKRGSFERIYGMTFTGGKGYAAIGYNEQQPMIYVFDTANPQVQTPILGKGPTTYYVTTNGTNVFWSALDPNDGGRNFVYVTSVADNSAVTFSGSTSTSVMHSPNYQAIDLYTSNYNAQISGMATVGSYLFVAHRYLDSINVLNADGEFVRNIYMPNVREIAADGTSLWAVSGTNTIEKYPVGEDGDLGTASVTITGVTAPLALGVHGTTIAIADGGSSQQVKAFSTTDGSALWTLGTAGGYSTSPVVSNNKFYFNDTRASYGSYIAFPADGSMWVGDAGNQRSQHYSADRSFYNRVQWLPASYSTGVDHSNINRIFSDYLEFDTTGTLKNNWGYNVETARDDQYVRLKGVNTLTNSRTYAMVGIGEGMQEIVELSETGLRYTGVEFGLNSQLYPDGNIYSLYQNTTGTPITWYKQTLTGFDGSNNPTYGSAVAVEASPNTTAADPAFRSNITTLTSGEKTTNGNYIVFDGSTTGSTDYHLGGVKDGAWMWRTAPNTHAGYAGSFPDDGSYDIGNGVNDFSGSKALVQDSIIVWGYHGEFYKNGQTNMWNIVHQSGLFLNQFGVVAQGQPIDGMAGNSFAASLVKDGNDLYLYHNDESYHSGVHRWRITGLNTIQLQLADITTTNEADTLPGVDLMEGLPFNTALVNNTAGWTRSPTTDNLTDIGSDYWAVKTSVKTYDKSGGRDVYARFRGSTGTAYVDRDLGTNTGLTSWKVTGNLSFDGNNGNNDDNNGSWLEVLDADGKTIASLGHYKSFVSDGVYNASIKANGTNIIEDDINNVPEPGYNTPFSIELISGNIKFTYGNYSPITVAKSDGTATVGNPKYLRMRSKSTGQNYDRIIDVSELRFVNH